MPDPVNQSRASQAGHSAKPSVTMPSLPTNRFLQWEHSVSGARTGARESQGASVGSGRRSRALFIVALYPLPTNNRLISIIYIQAPNSGLTSSE
jgi:hypothetical protein